MRFELNLSKRKKNSTGGENFKKHVNLNIEGYNIVKGKGKTARDIVQDQEKL